MMSDQLPNHIVWELEDAGIDINAEKKRLSRDLFDPLSAASKTALMRAGFTLYDQVTKREFEKAGSLDRADFLRRGGRVVGWRITSKVRSIPGAGAERSRQLEAGVTTNLAGAFRRRGFFFIRGFMHTKLQTERRALELLNQLLTSSAINHCQRVIETG
jgi:hypothetical protein